MKGTLPSDASGYTVPSVYPDSLTDVTSNYIPGLRDEPRTARSGTRTPPKFVVIEGGNATAGQDSGGVLIPDKASPVVSEYGRPNMDEMAREWVNARLEATEERMNAHLTRIESDMKVIISAIGGMGVDIKELKTNIGADIKELKSGQSNTKTVIFGSIIATGVTLAGIVLALFAYGKDMFELAITLTQTHP